MSFSAEFLAMLRKPRARRHFLAEVNGWNRDTLAEETLRFSTFPLTTGPSDSPASTRYKNVLVNPGAFARSMYTADGQMGGVVLPDLGLLEIDNGNADFDYLRRYDFDGRDVRILMGGHDKATTTTPERPWTYDRFQEIVVGTATGKLAGRNRVAWPLADLRARLDTDLLTESYTGMGACVSFDGTSQSVDFGNVHDKNASQSFTVEWRFRLAPNRWQTHVMVGKKRTTTSTLHAGYGAYTTTASLNVLNAVVSDGTTQVVASSGSAVRLFDDTWHHAALRVDRSTQLLTVFVDGVGGTPVSIAAVGSLTNIRNFRAGANDNLSVYGQLHFDDLRVWSVARTDQEIEANRNRVLQGTETNLADYWKFDESTGTSAASSVSGGATGTLTSSSMWAPTYEGFADLAGQPKPRIEGSAQNVEGRLIDPQRLIYQFNYSHVHDITNVYFGGVLKTLTTDYTVDRRTGTITCVANPAGTVTADVKGGGYGGYVTTASDICRRVATGYRPLLGDCLSFSSTKISYGDNFDRTGTFSAECWICPLDISTASQRILIKDDATNGWGLSLCDAGNVGSLRFFTRDLSTVSLDTPANTIQLGKWQHVAAVYDSAAQTKKIYVDGVLVASASSITGSLVGNAANFEVGSNQASGAYFNGYIDEPRLWSTARTAPELLASMYLEAVGTETGLVFADSLNVGTGTTTAATFGSVNGTVTLGSGAWVTSSDATTPVDAASFAALKTLQPAPVEHAWSDAITKLAASAEVLASISGYMTVTRTGSLYVGRVDRPYAARLGAGALRFYGGSAVLTIPHSSSLGNGVAWTFEGWFFPTSIAGTQVLMTKQDAGAYGCVLKMTAGELSLTAYNVGGTAGYVATGGPLVPYQWYHIAAQGYDGGSIRLVIDGVLADDTNTSIGYGGASASEDVLIGNDSSGLYGFRGLIDELRWWTSRRYVAAIALRKDAELAASAYLEAAETTPGATAQLGGYWRLNDGTGTTASDEVGSTDGTLGSGVSWVSADLTLRSDEVIDLVPKAIQVPTFRQVVGYGVNWTVQTGDDVSSSVTATRKAFLAEQRRFTSGTDSALIRAAHKLSRLGAAIEANFTNQADADAEMDRLQDLWGSDLEAYELTVQAVGFQVELGDLLNLTYERFGMESSVPLLVIGAKDDPLSGRSVLEVLR